MPLDINELQKLVGIACTIEIHAEKIYLKTPILSDTLQLLYNNGFDSLTDCFVTTNKILHIQLTSFETKQSIFIEAEYNEIDAVSSVFNNLALYRVDMLRYLGRDK